MGERNGNTPGPIAMANRVPIVGQPCSIHSFSPTVLVQCNCEAKTPLLLVSAGVAQCPGCQRRYQIGSVTYHLQRRQLEVGINLVVNAGDVPAGP